jgi:hypothetical protein
MNSLKQEDYAHLARMLREETSALGLAALSSNNLNTILSALDIVGGPATVALEPTMSANWKRGQSRCRHIMHPKIFVPYQCGRPAVGGSFFCPSHHEAKS